MSILERQEDKINRQVVYPYAQVFNPTQSYPKKNNTFIFNRAPDGYKFVLVAIDISGHQENSYKYGLLELSDGHYYTGWNIWPGVENRETLFRCELNDYIRNIYGDLHLWECKEYTIAIRSTHETYPFKCCVIVWYYLRRMTTLETKQYAVIQPKAEHYRKGGPTTIESTEE
jgi:hypothetical protein